MQELLPLSMEQIQKAFDNKELTVRSTVQDIRKYVKAVKGGTTSKVIEENGSELQQVRVLCVVWVLPSRC